MVSATEAIQNTFRGALVRNKLNREGRCLISESQRFWEDVLRLVDDQRVVPIVGQELLAVTLDGQCTRLYTLLARELSAAFEVESDALAPDDELHAVVKALYARGIDASTIYRELRTALRTLDELPTPAALTKLAQIDAFKLFVSTTFDGLLARAVDEVRFDAQRQTLTFSYAPSDKQDLPREFDRLERPTVYHLLGRATRTPGSYAITDQDRHEFLQSLQSKTEDAPQLLLDKLRSNDLLILGSRAADWITGFFVRNTRGGRVIESGVPAGTKREVVLLQHFGGGVKLFRGLDAIAFVNELHTRFGASAPGDGATPPAEVTALDDTPSGSVVLSFASTDRDHAESLRTVLDAAGVDVVADQDDGELDARTEGKLRSIVNESAVFIPLLSAAALPAKRRFFEPAWVETILEAKKIAPSSPFILPVRIDDAPLADDALPEELGELECVTLPGAQADASFIDTVVALQRRYRSASFV